MNQSVIQVPKNEIELLIEALKQIRGIEILEPTSQYESFRAKFHEGLVIVYTSGKVVIYGSHSKEIVTSAIKKISSPPTDIDVLVGSDEAGKGEWLGPMVTVAVALRPEDVIILRTEGVMDSKALSVERIDVLSKLIISTAVTFHTVTISPTRFNSFFAEVKNEGKTLNDMLAWSHFRVISDVYRVVESKGLNRVQVTIDEFDKVKTEKRLIHLLNKDNVKLIQKPRAEEETPVAAASIVARALRERWIDHESEKMGIDLRRLTQAEVLNLSNPKKVAKISYIKP